MRAVVFTLGCKVNECESDGIITALKNIGYEVFDKLVKADLYIVNTCAVTLEAEKKSRQMAARIKKLNQNAKIIWTGCASQNNPEAFLLKDKNSLVTGVFNKSEIINMLDKSGNCVFPQSNVFEEMPLPEGLHTRSYVKVQDGCNNFCSYCLIPYLRGRARSRNPKNIIEEIIKLNPKEAVINGINLSSYNFEGKNLTHLIQSLKDVECRIRLGSLEQGVIDKEFLSACKNLKNFAPHFHLSLQSGSDKVLKDMNRHYSRQEFINSVNLIREFFPTAGITTDIIVGFPTETEQDFLDTLDLCDKVKFSDIHTFNFSARKGTNAYKLKDINFDIKKQREKLLIEKKNCYKNQFLESQKGATVYMLIEDFKNGYLRGYSENYIRLYLNCDKISQNEIENLKGKIIPVIVGDRIIDGANAVLI